MFEKIRKIEVKRAMNFFYQRNDFFFIFHSLSLNRLIYFNYLYLLFILNKINFFDYIELTNC